jgi:hypothetical protein
MSRPIPTTVSPSESPVPSFIPSSSQIITCEDTPRYISPINPKFGKTFSILK